MSVDFLDSNVLVYLFDNKSKSKREVAEQLVEEGLRDSDKVISYQVVQEVLNVLTRKIAVPLSEADAQRFLQSVLQPLWRVVPSPALFQQGLSIQARYQLSFYDSMIVAAALEAGAKRLLTEDLQHGLRIEDLIVQNPF